MNDTKIHILMKNKMVAVNVNQICENFARHSDLSNEPKKMKIGAICAAWWRKRAFCAMTPRNLRQFLFYCAHLKELDVLFPTSPRFCKLAKKWLSYGQKPRCPLSNEPKILQIGQEMAELWSKTWFCTYVFAQIWLTFTAYHLSEHWPDPLLASLKVVRALA
eukprot:sb/3472726/